MTPTLLGRIQTRILLFIVLGLPITLLFSIYLSDWVIPPTDVTPFLVLATLLIVGLILDPVYIYLQRFRWDHDWPFAFQFFFSIIEFLIVLLIVWTDVLPYLPASNIADAQSGQINWNNVLTYTSHFLLVFIPSFLSLLGFVQIFMVRWRFKGGEWGRL